MSQFPPSFDQPRRLSSGLAVAAIICASIGLCVPGLGLVGLILGIVAISKASSSPETHGGRGAAIAAIIVGIVVLVLNVVAIGVLLPALAKAREAARDFKSSIQLSMIAQAMHNYANANKGWLPEAGADWQSRLSLGDPSIFVSPRDEHATAADSYIYIPGFNIQQFKDPATAVVLYENPKYVNGGQVSVTFGDWHPGFISVSQLQQTLDASEKPGATTKSPKPSGTKGGG